MRRERIFQSFPFVLALFWSGCSSDDGTPGEGTQDSCGEHGEYSPDHGHCECDEGYVEKSGTCVAAAIEECGGHGHLHGSTCHCDDGYVPSGNLCVEDTETVECGGHGHLHGDACHCDDGYVPREGTCVEDTETVECGGHGHLHDGACHCDDGYVPSEGTCIAEPELDCGAHGSAHGDHCDCDDGYVEEEGTCLVDCGEHGSRVDGVCECDDGFEPVGGTCVPEEEPECGGHGHLHGSVCHCDSGYTPVGSTCVEIVVNPPPPAELQYTIVRIGHEGMTSYGLALNDSRQVTGNTMSAIEGLEGRLRAFRWTPAEDETPALFEELGKLPYIGTSGTDTQFSRGYGINGAGVVVGESDNSFSQAFRWENGVMTSVGSLVPAGTGVARAINDSGVVVGVSGNRAFRATDEGISDLGSLDGLTNTTARAVAINQHGDAVGNSRNDANVTRATLWRANGSILNLGYLAPGQLSWAFDVNGSRQVVGSAIVSGSTYHAFFWEDGVLRDLGTLPSLPAAVHSEALGINADGWAVGYVGSIYGNVTFGTAAAVLWIDGQIYDLNDLLPEDSGWQLLSAQDINSHGDIVGFGRFQGVTSAFLLQRQHDD